jgi:hypothetical protein
MSDTDVRSLEPAAVLAPFPDDLRAAERAAASGARTWRVGLALSGGGIRSATFCLGVLQGLAKANLLRHVDYLSTVSGGGYCGSFVGRLFCRKDVRDLAGLPPAPTPSDDRMDAVRRILSDSRSDPIRFLRENGRFLAPQGAPDLVKGFAVALRNWVAVHTVMIISALFALCVFDRLTHAVFGSDWAAALAMANMPIAARSPFLAGASAIAALCVVALGWGYWLVPEAGAGVDMLRGWPRVLVVAALDALALSYPSTGALAGPARILAVAATATLAFYLAAWVIVLLRTRAAPGLAGRVHMLRSRFTQWLSEAMLLLVICLAVFTVDSIGSYLVSEGRFTLQIPTLYGGAVAVVGLLRPLLQWFARRGPDGTRIKVPLDALAGVLALLLLITALGALASVPKLIVAYSSATYGDLSRLDRAIVGLGLLTLVMGQVWIFVNRSSLYPTYEERLRRAYLGASNAARLDEDGPVPLADSHPDDGIPLADYHPERFGGPVHLINVTLNETVDGRSQVEQRDRKGLGLAVGAGGVSAGASHHALWTGEAGLGLVARAVRNLRASIRRTDTGEFRIFPARARPELLDLGQWVAVSGAAFSTGLGARTSFGLSVLAGLANVRLGYWWRSGVNPRQRSGATRRSIPAGIGGALRALLPVQTTLLDEWLARFPGVARTNWYLSDGGHFENTAAYELIRRQLPFIIVCDCGADPDYRFEDLGNLARKARTDFGATIEFLDRDGPDGLTALGVHSEASAIGTLDDLRRHAGAEADTLPFARRHAALARITYAPGADGKSRTGWLLVIKPTVTATMPVDVLHYQAEHREFPQQSTLDQFFDEAQWESHRCLGEHIATRVFQKNAGRWNPIDQLQQGT